MKTSLIPALLITAGLLSASMGAYSVETGPNPTLTSIKADGPFAVSSQTLSASGRTYGSATVYSPNTAGKYALIAVCPGFLMPQGSIQQLAKRMATHGFVVVSIGTKSLTDQPNSRATQLLDALKAAAALTTGAVKGKIDPARMGVAGWSMGGGGAMTAAGNTPGLKMALGWAPFNPDTSAFSKITVPVSITNGTNDRITPHEQYALAYYDMIPATTKKMVGTILDGSHFIYSYTVSEPASYTSIAWTKRFADGDTRYNAFLPAQLSDWVTFKSTL